MQAACRCGRAGMQWKSSEPATRPRCVWTALRAEGMTGPVWGLALGLAGAMDVCPPELTQVPRLPGPIPALKTHSLAGWADG